MRRWHDDWSFNVKDTYFAVNSVSCFRKHKAGREHAHSLQEVVGFGQFKVISDGLLLTNNSLVVGSSPKNRGWVFLPFAAMRKAHHKQLPGCPDTLFLHMVPAAPLKYDWSDPDAVFVSLIVCNRKLCWPKLAPIFCH